MAANESKLEVLDGTQERKYGAHDKTNIIIELYNMEKSTKGKRGRMSKADTKKWDKFFTKMRKANVNGGAAGKKIRAMFHRNMKQPKTEYKFNDPSL